MEKTMKHKNQIRSTDPKCINLVIISRHFKDDPNEPRYETYYAKISTPGKKNPKLEKIGSSKEGLGIAVMRKRANSVIERSGKYGYSDLTLGQAFDDFYYPELKHKKSKSLSEHKRLFNRDIKDTWGSYKITEIQRPHIRSWFRSMSEKTPGKANHCITIMKAIFNNLIDEGLISHNPLARFKKNPDIARNRVMDLNEKDRFRSAMERYKDPNHFWPWVFVMLLYLTGARKSEWANAKWENLKGSVLHLEDHKTKTKTNEERCIYLNDMAMKLLDLLPRENYPGENILKIKDPKRFWNKIRKEANIEDFRLHDFRHQYCSDAANEGINTIRIAKLVGHKSLASMQRYQHISNATAMKDADAIGNILIKGDKI